MTRRCPPPRKTPRLRPKAPVEVRREPFSIALAPDEAEPVPPDLARCLACGKLRPTPPRGLYGTNDVVCPHCRDCYAVEEPPAPVPPDLDDTRPRSIHNMIPDCPPGFEAGPMIEHGENDLATFREFFKSLGVPFEVEADDLDKPAADRETFLVVVAAHFVFDSSGRFVAVEHDETGERTARR